MDRYEADPDRAAQLAELVLEAGDPRYVDFDTLSQFLAKLRERSPELGDDVFQKALTTVNAAESPSSAALNQLGKYLFVDPKLREAPDEENRFTDSQIGASTITDFRRVRRSANPDAVDAYIRALLTMIDNASRAGSALASLNIDPTVLYALAIQMQPHAKELELASADALTAALIKIQTGSTAQVLAAVGGSVADPSSGSDASYRIRMARDAVAALRRKKFEDARQLLVRVADTNTTRQLGPLIDFAEAMAAVGTSDLDRATRRPMRSGRAASNAPCSTRGSSTKPRNRSRMR
jgi:hypothetical protein